MASASPTSGECPICFESFKTPKVLTCGHTFCMDCIERYIGDKTLRFPCPFCGENVNIPKGGARMFITNYVVHTPSSPLTENRSRSTDNDYHHPPWPILKHKCPNHSQREVDYYCNKCEVGLCSKCIYESHNGHEVLDIESETTKTKAIEELQHSEKLMKNRIKDLQRTHGTLQETSIKLKNFYDNSCDTMTQHMEDIIAQVKRYFQESKTDLKNNLDENELKLHEKREEVIQQSKNLEIELDTNLPQAEDSCLTILASLPKVKETQDNYLCEKMEIMLPDVTYVEWQRKGDMRLDVLGRLESKEFYIPGLNDFGFDVAVIQDMDNEYFNRRKFIYKQFIWSCMVRRFFDGYLGVFIYLLNSDNPSIQSCDVDFTLAVVNTNKKSQSIEKSFRHDFKNRVNHWGSTHFISFNDVINPGKGFITEDNQFIVRFIVSRYNNIQMVN